MPASILRTHGAAVAAALACGIVFALPHARSDSAFLHEDEWKSAAMIEAVRSGDWNYSEIYISEAAGAPWPYPRLPYWIGGAAAKTVGTERLFLLSDILLPPAVFLLLYLVLCRLMVRRSISIFAGLLYVLHHASLYSMLESASRRGWAWTLGWFLRPYLQGFLSEGSYSIARFPFSLLSTAVVLFMLLVTMPAVRHGRRWEIGVAGSLLGLITVLRFFDWVVIYPALSAAIAVALLKRDRARAVRLVWIVLIGLAPAAPYLVSAAGQSSDPAMAATLEHSGLERTHRLFPLPLRHVYPVGPACLLVLLAVCPIVGLRSPGRIAFCALVAGLVPAVSFQVVTGWTVAPDHWYRDHVLPFATLAAGIGIGVLTFRLLRERVARGVMIAAAAAAACAHAGALHFWYGTGESNLDALRAAGRLVPPGAVVLTMEPEPWKVAAPHAKSFLTCAPWSPVDTDELLRRYFIARRTLGDTDIDALFEPGIHADLSNLVGGETYVHYREFSGIQQGRIESIHLPPEARSLRLESAEGPGARRIDYILTVDDPRPEWGPPAYEGRSVRLYRYR